MQYRIIFFNSMNYCINQISNKYTDILTAFSIDYYKSPLESYVYKNNNFWIKRDDLLFLGCSKQRGLSYLFYHYLIGLNQKKFVLTSSGNSAVVACYIALHFTGVEHMIIVFSINITDSKLIKFWEKSGLKENNFDLALLLAKKDLNYRNVTINFSREPRKFAFDIARNGYTNVRTSYDDICLDGFKSLAYEIYEDVVYKNLMFENIFIPVSSGATALGLYLGLKSLNFRIRFNIIQTTQVFSLIKTLFNKDSIKIEDNHPAKSIVDFVGNRRNQILDLINETNGRAFIISSNETFIAYEILKNLGINTSYDSALSFAAYQKANYPSNSLLIFTG